MNEYEHKYENKLDCESKWRYEYDCVSKSMNMNMSLWASSINRNRYVKKICFLGELCCIFLVEVFWLSTNFQEQWSISCIQVILSNDMANHMRNVSKHIDDRHFCRATKLFDRHVEYGADGPWDMIPSTGKNNCNIQEAPIYIPSQLFRPPAMTLFSDF